jgi:RNA polymerase sigma factor (sigma-70 family)
MPEYRNNSVLELKNQLMLSPRKVRLEQLRRLEQFIDRMEPNRAYPYEFVFYTITEHRPTENKGVLLSGAGFVRDMVQMADDVSASLHLGMDDITKPFFSRQDVMDHFGVSRRTLVRWRGLGLRSRKIVFDGWRRKTIYLAEAVKAFERRNSHLVRKSRAFSRLTAEEKAAIVRLARAINSSGTLSISEVARMISEKLNRSREAVRYTLREHDRTLREPIFDDGFDISPEERKTRILDSFRKGVSVQRIAERVKRHKATIYRIIHQRKAEEILARHYEYMYEDVFDSPYAERLIGGETEPPRESRARVVLGKAHVSGQDGDELLSRQEEYELFRKYSFYKYKCSQLSKRLEQGEIKGSVIRKIDGFHKKAVGVKKKLVSANLALVAGIAKRHLGYHLDFHDLVSEGNIKLLHAIEKFDYTRGVRFSTYASWAIIKHYARLVPAENYRTKRFITGADAVIENVSHEVKARGEDARLVASLKSMVAGILEGLSERERYIIVHRFGLEDGAGVQTLEEIAATFGLSRERIRQIEKKTLDKLKGLIDDETGREVLG